MGIILSLCCPGWELFCENCSGQRAKSCEDHSKDLEIWAKVLRFMHWTYLGCKYRCNLNECYLYFAFSCFMLDYFIFVVNAFTDIEADK